MWWKQQRRSCTIQAGRFPEDGTRLQTWMWWHETAKPCELIYLGWAEKGSAVVQDWGVYSYKWRELEMHPRKSFGCHLIFAFTGALFRTVIPIVGEFNPLVQFLCVGLHTVWDQWCKLIDCTLQTWKLESWAPCKWASLVWTLSSRRKCNM